MMTEQLFVITSQPVSFKAAKYLPVLETKSENTTAGDIDPSLTILASLDSFSIYPAIDTWLNDVAACLLPKQFLLLSPDSQICFKICEESSLSCRIFCPLMRTFSLHAQDKSGRIVFSIKRKFRCCNATSAMCPCSCKNQTASVELANGNEIGVIIERMACCSSEYSIQVGESSSAQILSIPWPPCKSFASCSDSQFQIVDSNSNQIGEIKLHWTSCKTHMCAPSDPYSIKFFENTDLRAKILVIAAVFFIDFQKFETGRCRKYGAGNSCLGKVD